MEYADERILELKQLKNKQERQQQINLDESILIGEELLEFEDILLFEDRMSVRIPKNFRDMPMEMAKMKYMAENRPQIIKMNESGVVNITFSWLNQPMQKKEIETAMRQIKMLIKRVNPTNIFYDMKVEENESVSYGWFDYKSVAIDGAVYNIMSFLIIDGTVVMCSFNCPYKGMEDWKPVAIKMIASVCDMTREVSI